MFVNGTLGLSDNDNYFPKHQFYRIDATEQRNNKGEWSRSDESFVFVFGLYNKVIHGLSRNISCMG